MIRLALRRLLLLAAWSAVLLLLTRPLIRNTDNVTIHNKHEDAQVMDKLDQGGLNKSTFQSQLICARYCYVIYDKTSFALLFDRSNLILLYFLY